MHTQYENIFIIFLNVYNAITLIYTKQKTIKQKSRVETMNHTHSILLEYIHEMYVVKKNRCLRHTIIEQTNTYYPTFALFLLEQNKSLRCYPTAQPINIEKRIFDFMHILENHSVVL